MNDPSLEHYVTPLRARGLNVGDLVIVEKDMAIPAGSLARIVFDDNDMSPAVEVLIPTDSVRWGLQGAATIEGGILISSMDVKNNREISVTVQEDKEYHWVSGYSLTKVENNE